MKGKTIIELKDINTGHIESHQDDNMVTNALRDMFNTNLNGFIIKNNELNPKMLPIVGSALGGVLLFTDPLEENPDNYYAPSSNPCVGYASNDANNTDNNLRGSFNKTESKKLDNGYRFVWDFATSQGNGTISSVALTSKYGGENYFNDFTSTSSLISVRSYNYGSNGDAKPELLGAAIDADFNEGIYTLLYYNEKDKLLLQKIKKPILNIELFQDLSEDTYEILETTEINPEKFKPYRSNREFDVAYYNYGNYYCVMRRKNLNTISWIKVNKIDGSFSEGDWTFKDMEFYQLGQHDYYFKGERYMFSTVCGQYLYALSKNRDRIYKINMENTADVKEINISNIAKMNSNTRSSMMYTFKDYVIGNGFYITSDDNVIARGDKDFYFAHNSIPIYCGPYVLRTYRRSSDGYREVLLVTPYLATINNLSSPIIKTADKTMKIIYEVTQE